MVQQAFPLFLLLKNKKEARKLCRGRDKKWQREIFEKSQIEKT